MGSSRPGRVPLPPEELLRLDPRRTGSGILRARRRSLAAWPRSWTPSSARPSACARRRARGGRRYLEDARLRADALVAERQRRIAVVSDELLAKAEAVVARLDDAAPVREGFENLVRALAVAAERLARETDGGSQGQPPPPARSTEYAPGRHFGGQPHPARAPSAPEARRTGP